MTGMINEERMSVYVRLGIRLLYKGLKSREMEKKRGMQCFLPHKLTRLSRLSTSSESDILRSNLPISFLSHRLETPCVLLIQADEIYSSKAASLHVFQARAQVRRPCLRFTNSWLHQLPSTGHERGSAADRPIQDFQRVLLSQAQTRGPSMLCTEQSSHRRQSRRLPLRRLQSTRRRPAHLGQRTRIQCRTPTW